MKPTLHTLSDGHMVIVVTNRQLWNIVFRVAWAMAWPTALALGFGLLVARGCHLWE